MLKFAKLTKLQRIYYMKSYSKRTFRRIFLRTIVCRSLKKLILFINRIKYIF